MCGLVILVVFFNEVKAKISATTRSEERRVGKECGS